MEKLKMDLKYHKLSLLIRLIVNIAAILTVGVLIAIVVYILYRGIPNITPQMFEAKYTSENASVVPALINTLITIVVTLLIAVPIGIFSAVYMTEYAKRGNKLVKVVRLMSETLSGIPSIVFGLFGYLFFVVACKFDYSLLAGSLTLAIMVLPTIMTTTEEALRSIPDSYRVILPSAIPGILAGVILSIGRIIGETAALIYTAGSVAKVPDSLMGSGRTLAVHMYVLFNEGLSMERAYGTAVILLLLVLAVNLLSNFVASTLIRKKNR